jgi:hypothetical protein
MSVLGFFKKPEEKLFAAQYAVSKSAFGGRNGVVRVELDPGTNDVKFIINATGDRFDTIEEAYTRASGMMFTQFSSIKPVSGSILNLGRGTGPNLEAKNPAQNAAVGDIILNIQERLREAIKDPNTLRQLESMGFSQAALSSEEISLNIATIKNQRGIRPVEFLQRLRKQSQPFIPIIDKEGATLMQFKMGEKILTEAETYFMLSTIGNPLLNNTKLMTSLTGGSGALEDFMAKLGKRVRGIVGDRDLTITMDMLRAAGPRRRSSRASYRRRFKLFAKIFGTRRPKFSSNESFKKRYI